MTATPPNIDRDDALAALHHAVGRTLVWGFRTSALILAVGLALLLLRGESLTDHLPGLDRLLRRASHGHGDALVGIAIVVMVLTPVAAVLTIAVGFLRLNDRRDSLISLAVLLILVVSIAVSLVG